ncbi:PIN domain-containing protein [Tessaracoccus palaemonis]|uniref:PIN domain-containing protein n=1 Tax=Tessaracoccus palaemonis TaxID=2829499 RepID=A0ABX8SN40_9ACTN|nr:PIN domain-containing protein [Tessaracoccus palaemonis]QXT63478.1 PIN domain-containing protein [Tessaracoccus palaemonis]
MARYSAVLDSCVMVPVALCDIHLRLAERLVFRPVWSERIISDARKAVLRIHPEIDPGRIGRRFQQMNEAFPDAEVHGHETLIDGLELPDPDDRHVLAAAIVSGADAIVTANLRDFPGGLWERFGVEIISPDDFLLNQLDMANRVVIAAIEEQAAATTHPSLTLDDLLGVLTRAGAPRFADEVSLRLR